MALLRWENMQEMASKYEGSFYICYATRQQGRIVKGCVILANDNQIILLDVSMFGAVKREIILSYDQLKIFKLNEGLFGTKNLIIKPKDGGKIKYTIGKKFDGVEENQANMINFLFYKTNSLNLR